MGARFAVLMMLAGGAFAQTPEVSLRIETGSGRTQFRIGETIDLKLTYESAAADKWMLHTTGRDRSVIAREEFRVSPKEGTSDPLGFRAREGFVGSILGGVAMLGKPWSEDLDLNQWVRFDRAGRYRVSALVHVNGKQRQELPVSSNEIEIEVVPAEKEWLAEQLRQAVAVLDAPARNDQQAFDALAAAVRTIWYLDTPQSVREAARLLGTLDAQTAQPLQLALRGSAHQAVAIAAMKQLLPLPGQGVTPAFIQTLALMDAGDAGAANPSGAKHGEAVGATVQQLRRELAGATSGKAGEARAVSLYTLISGMRFELVTENLRTELTAVFMDLPFQQQRELLTSEWGKIAGPGMIPVLLRIYEDAPALPGLHPSLAPEAVRRLNEIDPARARALILNEIKLEQPKLRYETLAMLPDATLPELDSMLLDRLQRNGSTQELIARYATADILDGVKAWDARRRQPSTPALIAYYLRVDPAWGERVLRQALSAPNAEWLNPIGKTADYYVSPEWEKVAIEGLGNSVVAVKSDAVKALGDHGSAASAKAVMEAFHAWHEWWKDRPAEMVSETMYEQRFLNATAHAKNWVADTGTLEKIRDYCITSQCRNEAGEYLRQWMETPKIYVAESDTGEVRAGFAQYLGYTLDAARERLMQIPAGTRVKWNSYIGHTPQIAVWIAAIDSDLAGRGVVVTP